MLSAAMFVIKARAYLSSIEENKKMRTVSQINNRLWHVHNQLETGCKPGKGAPRKLHPDEVDNIQCEEDFLQTERCLAKHIAARLAREAEQAKLAQQAEQSLSSGLERASTADLLSLQCKLQAAECNVKVLLQQKQTHSVVSLKLKEREESKIRKSNR